jgi:hypothetical protein
MEKLQRSLLVALSLSLAAAPGVLAGTLTVRPGVPSNGGSARFSGTQGLEVDVANPNRNPAFVQSSQPSAEATYRVRFYVNLRTLTMTDGDQFDLFVAYDGADPVPPTITGNAVLRLALGQSGGVKQLNAFARLNGGTEAQSPAPIPLANAWRSIEINWAKATASGANNGRLDLWVDGHAQTGLTGLNNDTMTINYARWGTVAGVDAGTAGTFRLDDFASQRSGYIGPAFPFTDNPTSGSFFPFIQGIYAAEVIPECAAGSFCPNNAITRKEMAKFLLLSKLGASFTPPACTVPMFTDVPCSHPYATWINEIAREGITSGCGAGLYCPDGNITRSQMAVFLMVARGFPPAACPPSTFLDVPTNSPFCGWINQVAAQGITAGCGGGNYCPESLVLRGQMSVFLSVAFGIPTHIVGP